MRNVTDIDDKTLAKAAEAGVDVVGVGAASTSGEFHAAYDARRRHAPPRTSRARRDTSRRSSRSSRRLVESGHAYERDGSVYFDVRSFDAYGALTNQALEDLTPRR